MIFAANSSSRRRSHTQTSTKTFNPEPTTVLPRSRRNTVLLHTTAASTFIQTLPSPTFTVRSVLEGSLELAELIQPPTLSTPTSTVQSASDKSAYLPMSSATYSSTLPTAQQSVDLSTSSTEITTVYKPSPLAAQMTIKFIREVKPTTPPAPSSPGLSVTTIASIIVGSMVGSIILITTAVMCWRASRRRAHQQDSSREEQGITLDRGTTSLDSHHRRSRETHGSRLNQSTAATRSAGGADGHSAAVSSGSTGGAGGAPTMSH
ncbi:hypothetical protein F4804DRAFT_339456 [Jackrogersella minutella]|nr:hypothetical protein F4804DRAFT_339456 [Jackrogersella minutella]